ncbi:LMOD3 protein, partial [Polypterus senegalus]
MSDRDHVSDEDIDEDEILATLSPEELQQLQSDMDDLAPDERVPVGMRQRDQSDKPPTGPFDHRSLVDYLYWQKESTRMLDERQIQEDLENGYDNEEENSGAGMLAEENEPEKQVGHLPVTFQQENDIQESRGELERGKVKTTKPAECAAAESRDLEQTSKGRSHESLQPASTTQESSAEEERKPPAESQEKTALPKVSKLKLPEKLALGGNLIKLTSRPSGNETNLETTLDKIRKNSAEIREVNLNNIENIPKDMLMDYVNALKKNKHVATFSIANTGVDDTVAYSLANMLRENKSIRTLNIESNVISGKGVVAIIRCLQFNETLTELRFHNQRYMLGHQAEMEISRLLKANHTLLKMGYHFELPGPRMVVTNLLSRNLDRQRQKRFEEQKRQQVVKEEQDMLAFLENSASLPPAFWEMLDGCLPPMAALQESPPKEPSRPLKVKVKKEVAQMPPRSNSPTNPLKDFKLKKVSKHRETNRAVDGNEKQNLKEVIKTLKPIPRRRQPPKVQLTPRDELLSEIRHSNIAYLKPVSLLNYEDGALDPSSIIPLIDGGTEGFKGNARVILPGMTACIDCTLDLYPPQINFPMCTIASMPRLPEHCIEYVRVLQWPKEQPFGDGVTLDGDDPEHIQWVFHKALERGAQFKITGVTYRLTQASCATEVFKLASSAYNPLNNYLVFNDVDGLYTYTFEAERKANENPSNNHNNEWEEQNTLLTVSLLIWHITELSLKLVQSSTQELRRAALLQTGRPGQQL